MLENAKIKLTQSFPNVQYCTHDNDLEIKKGFAKIFERELLEMFRSTFLLQIFPDHSFGLKDFLEKLIIFLLIFLIVKIPK